MAREHVPAAAQRFRHITRHALPASNSGARAIVSEAAGGGFSLSAMTFDNSGSFWAADVRGEGVQEFSSSGTAESFLPVHDPRTGQPAHLGSIAFDAQDNLYAWADYGVDQLWEFSAEGNLIRTIGSNGSGTGQFGSVDDIAFGANGTVYVDDGGNNRVAEVSSAGAWLGTLGTGKTGSAPGDFDNPTDVATDTQGNVFVADSGNTRIEEFAPNGTLVTQWPITTGSAGASYSIAIGTDDSVYVVDSLGGELAKYSATGSLIWNAQATAQNVAPLAIAVSPQGAIFVANASVIWNITADGAANFWFREPGTAVAQLDHPWGLAVDAAGGVYVASTSDASGVPDQRLDYILPAHGGTPVWVELANFSNVYSGAIAGISNPSCVTIDTSGSLYVGDGEGSGIVKFPIDNDVPLTWKTPANDITAIAVDRHGLVYVADYSGYLRIFNAKGHLLGTAAHFHHLLGMAFDPHGNLYLSDVNAYFIQVGKKLPTQHGSVIELSPGGKELHVWKTPVIGGLAIDGRGHVFAAEYNLDRIEEFSAGMKPIAHWGKAGYGPGEFDHPSGVAIGPQGRIYVADTDNDRVQVLTSAGKPMLSWGIDYYP